MQMRGLKKKSAQIVESGPEIDLAAPGVELHLSRPFLGRFSYCLVLTQQLSLTHASSLELSRGLSLPQASWLCPKSLQRKPPSPALGPLS